MERDEPLNAKRTIFKPLLGVIILLQNSDEYFRQRLKKGMKMKI